MLNVMARCEERTTMENEFGSVVGDGRWLSSSDRECHFRSIADSIPALIALMTPAGAVESVNRQALDYFGATLEELKGWASSDTVHPDDLPEVVAAWARSVGSGEPYDIEHRIRRADGMYRWFHVRGLPIRDTGGRVSRWCVLQTDIDDRKRAEAILAGEKRVLEMIATGRALSETLTQLCLLVQQLSSACVSCSILLLDPESKKLWHAASPNVPRAYTTSIDGFVIGPNVSSCGTAAFYGKQVIASDIESDPRWAEFRDVALANGLRACWSTPIFSQETRVLGTFAMFSGCPSCPTAEDQEVIAQITHLASIAIEREQSQTSLTRALDKIKKSEARLRTIIDTIPTIAWCTAPDGSGEFWNQRWHDYTGLTLEVARGWGWETVIHPEDLSEVMDTWRRYIAAGQAGEVEGRLRRSDGEYRWFLFRFCPLWDETGNIVNWYGTNIDIEDRKRAETLLAGEKQLLEMVAGGQPMSEILDGLCHLIESTVTGCHCSVILVDRSGTRLEHGAAPSLPNNFTTSIVGLPVNVESGPCAMAICLNEQVVSADLAMEIRWAGYEWCPMALANGLRACWATPISSTGGKALGAFAIYYSEPKTPTPIHQKLIEQFTNIASIAIERTQNNSALKRSEAFLIKGQLLSLTGTFSWNVTTDEVTVSEQYYRIFELDPGAPVTVDLICSRVHPEDLPLLSKMIDRARADGSCFDYEHRLLMPDQSVKYVNMVAHATRDPDGQFEYIGAVQDITQRRISEEALGKARSELARVARVTSFGALTASIAHEVNQPLSGIITNASTCLRWLAADPPNIDGARETARRTIRDGNRASEVITRLRALFTKKDVTTEPFDLNEATEEVIALSLRELQKSRVILRPEFADDLPPVTGDRVQLQQVILNLLLNASDAMSTVDDRPRQLLIKTERDEEHVRLTVQDVGVGFELQGIDKVFEAFYTTKCGGMGIGLSVSRSIIESHRGRLWATPNDGPGATFSFSIPCQTNGSLRPARSA